MAEQDIMEALMKIFIKTMKKGKAKNPRNHGAKHDTRRTRKLST